MKKDERYKLINERKHLIDSKEIQQRFSIERNNPALKVRNEFNRKFKNLLNKNEITPTNQLIGTNSLSAYKNYLSPNETDNILEETSKLINYYRNVQRNETLLN